MERIATTDDLLFVSFAGKVHAVDRLDGSILWTWKAPKGGGGSVTILPDVDRLFVSANGYTWALDPCTGTEIWHQSFKRMGVGHTMLATMRSGSEALAMQRQPDETPPASGD